MSQSEKIIVIFFSTFYILLFTVEIILFFLKIKIPKFNLKKILITNIILVLFGLVGMFILSYTNYLDYEKPIPYSQYDRIGFKNFRGINKKKKEFLGSKYFAYVVTTIEIDEKNNSIEAFFHPSKSFVYNKKSSMNDLLSHELYHFKITEYFARKTRKEVIEKNICNFNEKEKILNENLVEEKKFQILYDYETYHSYIYFKQIKFEKKIDSLLLTLNKYTNPKLSCNEKN